MDEATIERLSDLVKGMHDQGMSVKQIQDNLVQMGISSQDIDVIISRAGLKPSASDIHENVVSVKRAIETGEAVKPVVEKLGEAEEHFERIHSSLNRLHEKHGEISERLSRLSASQSDIQEIKELLYELRDTMNAIKKLQQDLIEINRRVLVRESMK